LGVAAHAERPTRALVDVLHLDFLPCKAWLAEAVGEEFLRNVAVLLADFHVKPFRLTVDHASLGQRLAAIERQQQGQSYPPHPYLLRPSIMLQNIPTHVIAGPLGAGKTSLIRHLLAQRPDGERWAVLINEFGQIGIDAALLTREADGIALGEVAGGCLCCVNGAPFQVGLGRLLRKARPDRLFIEPSGLGHPAQLLRQLREAPWQGVLSVQPCVLVLDAEALAAGKPLPAAQQEALESAGLLLMNKSEHLDEIARQRLVAQLPVRPLYWTHHAALPLSQLPGLDAQAVAGVDNFVTPKGLAQLPAIWTDPALPICMSQEQEDGWSIGWRWHPSQAFDTDRIARWLAGLDWRRAKLVIHAIEGWMSANALDNAVLEWRSSEWRQDSRIELIFSEPQDIAGLQQGLDGCRLR
jgi:G3E family GTPase